MISVHRLNNNNFLMLVLIIKKIKNGTLKYFEIYWMCNLKTSIVELVKNNIIPLLTENKGNNYMDR